MQSKGHSNLSSESEYADKTFIVEFVRVAVFRAIKQYKPQ